jgi:hypothetical protein
LDLGLSPNKGYVTNTKASASYLYLYWLGIQCKVCKQITNLEYPCIIHNICCPFRQNYRSWDAFLIGQYKWISIQFLFYFSLVCTEHEQDFISCLNLIFWILIDAQKKKLSDKLGSQWSKEELQRFYEAYRKYGKDWKKVCFFLFWVLVFLSILLVHFKTWGHFGFSFHLIIIITNLNYSSCYYSPIIDLFEFPGCCCCT